MLKLLYRYIVIASLFFLTACEKDDVKKNTDREMSPTWEEHQSIALHNKILLNSFVMGDSICVFGSYNAYFFDTTQNEPVLMHSISNPNPLPMIPATGEWMFAISNQNSPYQASIYAPNYRKCSGASSNSFVYGIQLGALNSEYSIRSTRALQGWYTQVDGAFNKYNQFLMMVSDSAENCYNCSTSFALINLNPSISSGVFFESCLDFTPSVKRIPNEDKSSRSLATILAHDTKFIVSFPETDHRLKIIDTSGAVSYSNNLGTFVSQLFSKGDTLYAFAIYSGKLFRSTDGINWDTWIEGFPGYDFRFFTIDENIYLYIYSQIFWLDAANLKLIEIDNTNIATNEITSVTVFYDKVYVTTLSGLFTKLKKYFHQPKVEQDKELPEKSITLTTNQLILH